MFKQLKKFTVQMLAGANIATVVVMLLVGYSDRLYPADHPILSTLGMTFPLFLIVNLLFLFFWLIFKWTRSWIPVGGFLLAYVPISIYMPLHPGAAVDDGDLMVMSYNVCGYGGNYKYDNGFERVCDYMKKYDADIVCVQEDIDTWRRNVKQEYDKFYAHNDTAVIANHAKSFNALGIHTKYPILRREHIEYESNSNGSVAWWLQVKGDTVIVLNNHFESCHLDSTDRRQYRQMLHGEMARDSVRSESQILLVKLAEANAKRCKQIDAVLDYVRQHSRYATIVCGDFNDNPISYSRHAMSQVLTDCYVTAGNGVGLSYNQKAFSLRIDHIFCSHHFVPSLCKIDGEMDASDHNPVLCWLKMKRNDGN